MKFFQDLGKYLLTHKLFMLLLIVGVVALLVLIITMIVVSKKRKAKAKAQKNETATPQQAPAPTVQPAKKKIKPETPKQEEPKPVQAQKTEQKDDEAKKAARQAVFDKLEAQRIEAEKEDAEQAKKEKKAQKATAKKTSTKKAQPAKEELSVAQEEKQEPTAEIKTEKKTTVKKTTAKKAEPKQETTVAKPAPQKATAKKAVEETKPAPAPVPAEDESDTAVIARYAGKWVIYHLLPTSNNPEDEMYFFELHASNGETLLTSEEYTSYNGALKGIDTYKSNIAKDNFKITVSKKGTYIFKLMSGKNTLLCNGANYPTRMNCESAIKSTKRFAKTAIIDEHVQDQVVNVSAETDTTFEPLPEGLAGKWIISSRQIDDEKVFFFELFANNGEKLLSSEEYTTYVGAVNGIQTHKQNIAKGNFRISLTKNGDYIYKLLNGNNQLLCLGEHYKTKSMCQNAVESVKRFSVSSPTLTDAEHLEN